MGESKEGWAGNWIDGYFSSLKRWLKELMNWVLLCQKNNAGASKEALNWDKNPEVVKREGKLSYCVVHKWDTTQIIRSRLARTPEFSYLSERQYAPDKSWRSTIWFNISDRSLKPWMQLQIPLKVEDRQLSDKDFFNNCKSSVSNLKSHPIYWKKISDLSNKIWDAWLARVMTAFAKVETAGGNPATKIWTWWLYRYESTTSYSISYFHILKSWWWEVALKNLGFSEWDTCDSTKAWMLFLAYWCECESYIKNKFKFGLEDCLNPKRKDWYIKAAKVYNNWSKSYPNALKKSYDNLQI